MFWLFQGLANFFYKGQIADILGFAGPHKDSAIYIYMHTSCSLPILNYSTDYFAYGSFTKQGLAKDIRKYKMTEDTVNLYEKELFSNAFSHVVS